MALDLVALLEYLLGLQRRLIAIDGKVNQIMATTQDELNLIKQINDSTNATAGVVGALQTTGTAIKTKLDDVIAQLGAAIAAGQSPPQQVMDQLQAAASASAALTTSLGQVQTFLQQVADTQTPSGGNPPPPPPPPPPTA